MASGVYSRGLIEIISGNQDWKTTPTATWKAQLTLSSYTPNKETHEYLDDVSASKVSGTTDQTLTGASVGNPTADAANNRVEMDYGASLTWSSVASGTVRYVIIYEDSGVPSTSPLLCFLDFSGGDVTANGGDITVEINADGVWAVEYGL